MVLAIDKTPIYSSLYDRTKVLSNLVPRESSLEYRLSRFNRYKNVELENFHAENYRGHVFITKPQLNLSDLTLKYDEMLSTLITNIEGNDENEIEGNISNSLPFSIKCNLDSTYFIEQIRHKNVQKSTVINKYSPFIIPLYNAIEDISGYPDPILETETRPTGFHQEDQTYALGYDDLVRSYDLSLTFNEIESDYISFMFYIWIIWMGLVRKGIIMPYADAIEKRYLCYTSSIYRIITDSTDNKIKHWAKATGCFPKSVPYGNFFNMPSGEPYNTTTRQITIPFTTNKLEYDNPYILLDFNKLIHKYALPISEKLNAKEEDDINLPIIPRVYDRHIGSYDGLITLPQEENISHLGIPYITSNDNGYTLSWLAEKDEYDEYNKIKNTFNTRDIYGGIDNFASPDPRSGLLI